jgi:hypothetical protein
MAQRLLDLGRGVESGQHDAGSTKVENPTQPDAGGGFHPDHCRNAVGGGREHDGADQVLPARPVLEIENQPVHSGGGACFGRDGRRCADERAHGLLAGGDASAQVATV